MLTIKAMEVVEDGIVYRFADPRAGDTASGSAHESSDDGSGNRTEGATSRADESSSLRACLLYTSPSPRD